MEESSKKIVATLNDLIEINHDRREGYKVAVAELNDPVLQELFARHSQQSEAFASELEKQVIELEGEPVEGTRTDGKIYRVWMDIKAALSGNDRMAILNSCEYGEDVALRTYEEALMADVILPVQVRQIISKQKRELQEAHNTIKSLRDAPASTERHVF
jgi:uncharacterized protein (TIGR02284 family)